MRLNKKIAVLTLCAAAHLVAAAWDLASGGLFYNVLPDGQAEVAPAIFDGRSAYSGTVIIPEHVHFDGNTLDVTAIADSAFFRSDITALQIPNSVTYIGRWAMADAFSLADVTLPLHLGGISQGMLAGTDIAAIAIPDGVTAIDASAFEDCHRLETVMLPYTIAEIGDYTFDGCGMLRELYCAAPVPPALGDHALPGHTLDVVLPDRNTARAWQAENTSLNPFKIDFWINDGIAATLEPADEPTDDGRFQRVDIGQGLGWNIYGPDGYLKAFTAADKYYIERDGVRTNYVAAASNQLRESEDATTITLPFETATIERVDKPQPRIVGIDGTIHIEGDNYGTWTRVYDIYGRLFYERPSVEGNIRGLDRGRVYIVIVGDYVRKVIL